MITIRPGWRQFMARTFAWDLLLLTSVSAAPYVTDHFNFYVNIAHVALSVAIILIVGAEAVMLRCIRWMIDEENLCRRYGLLSSHTSYVELYRVIDYSESQTIAQRIFKVKTVTITSTDNSDPYIDIYGVPVKTNLIGIIRTRVEKCKKEKRIYEITNN